MQNKHKLLIGGMSLSAVAVGVALTGGTSAYYYDLEKTTNNSISACDFDLTQAISTQNMSPGGTQSTVNPNGTVSIAKVQPGDKFAVTVTLDNAGSCAGDLWADIDNHANNENGVTEPESSAGDSAANGTQDGELGDYLVVDLTLDGHPAYHGSLSSLGAYFPARIDGDFTGTDAPHVFVATITAPDGGQGAENKIMTDSYTFDLDFALAQKGHFTGGQLG